MPTDVSGQGREGQVTGHAERAWDVRFDNHVLGVTAQFEARVPLEDFVRLLFGHTVTPCPRYAAWKNRSADTRPSVDPMSIERAIAVWTVPV